MHYEFESHRTRKGRNKYVGSWTETACRTVPLPYTREALHQVLRWGAQATASPFNHQEIAQWCDRMHMAHLVLEIPPDLKVAIRVAADVDCQWYLFLATTYTFEQLSSLDYSLVRLPIAWFVDWQKQLESTWPGEKGSL